MSPLFVELVTLVALIAGLILFNAALVAGDSGLVKLRMSQLDSDRRDDEIDLPWGVSALLSDIARTSRIIRMANTFVTTALGLALASLFWRLGAALPAPAEWLMPFAVVAGVIAAVSLHFLTGELASRALALSHPMQALRITSWVIHFVRFLLRPLAMPLTRWSARLGRFCRIDAELELSLVDADERIRSLLSNGNDVSPIMDKIVRNAVNLQKRVAQDILLPRNRIQYLDLKAAPEANMEIIRKSGHTRFPLCEGDLDRCIGLIHIKDVIRCQQERVQLDPRAIRRGISRFSPDDRLDIVLQRLLKLRLHMALVTDEFGGTVGVITLEDVLEQLVGEIQDEFDREETVIQALPGGEFQIDGLAPIHEVAEALQVEIDNPDVSTFGGYITAELGRMPSRNTVVRIGRLEIQITGATEKRITSARVRITPIKEKEGEGDAPRD